MGRVSHLSPPPRAGVGPVASRQYNKHRASHTGWPEGTVGSGQEPGLSALPPPYCDGEADRTSPERVVS